VGLVRGAYGFSQWDLGTDPAAEARWFLAHLPALEAGDFVALDIETSPVNIPGRPLSSWALTWLTVVAHALGFRPLVYSGAFFASQFLTDVRMAIYGKWVAAYGAQAPSMAAPWESIAMWQHTSEAVYAGMNVDEDFLAERRQYPAGLRAAAPA
jgi:GH25 family lysozyme M1 (1,4-beta-N-acetylmuramidase)